MKNQVIFYILFFSSFFTTYSTLFLFDEDDFNEETFQFACVSYPLASTPILVPMDSNTDTKCAGDSLFFNNGDFNLRSTASPTYTIKHNNINPSDSSYDTSDLTGSKCKLSNFFFDINSFNATFKAQLKPFGGATIYGNLRNYLPDVLDRNYHMKVFSVMEVTDKDNPSLVRYFRPDSIAGTYTYSPSDYNSSMGGKTRIQLSREFLNLNSIDVDLNIVNQKYPYVLATPESQNYSFSNAENILTNLCATTGDFCSYDVNVFVVPIDGKCDLRNYGGGLSTSEYEVHQVSNSYSGGSSIIPKNLTVLFDTSLGDVESNASGSWVSITSASSGFQLTSSSKYSKVFNYGETISFRNYAESGYVINSTTCGIFETFERRNFQECTFTFNSSTENQTIQFIPYDLDEDSVPDYLDECLGSSGLPELMGCSDVSSLENKDKVYYEEIECSSVAFFNSVSGAFSCFPLNSITFFQEIGLVNGGNILGFIFNVPNPFSSPYPTLTINSIFSPNTSDYYSGDYICRGKYTNIYTGHCRLSAKVNYSEHSYFNQYRDLEIRKREINSQNVTFLAPFDSPVKYADSVIKDVQTEEIFFEDQNGNLEKLNLSPFSSTIGVTKQEDYREIEVNENDLALALTDIKYFLDAQEVEDKVDSVIATMQGLNISQTINITTSKNPMTKRKELIKSRITLNISNISNSKKRLSLYYSIPKESAQDYSDIIIISEPTGSGIESFVTDKDPIIGWYFEDPSDSEVVVIEVPGDSEGGTVIVSEEPVLYNSGDLVVRYREDTCASDEQLLFELDSLINSKVYMSGEDTNFKVCLAHLIDNLSLGGTNTEELFSILGTTQKVSTTLSGNSINVAENTGKYWSTLIQRDNPGDYSCIGSFNNLEDSYFGDCDYNEDLRLWIKLGEDTTLPQISTFYPTLGNTIELEILIEDLQSGVNWSSAKYCIDYGTSCIPSISYSSGEKVFVSCSGSVGCIKYLNVTVSDNEGNTVVYSEPLRLLNKGSSCKSDCTASPSPNRYLAECSGLNNCQYYQYDVNNLFDSGEYVANQCDFTIEGSWVYYNLTHEIQCPKGPFRVSKFTQEDVEILDRGCGLLQTTEYPVIIDGESMIMNIVSCIE